MHRRPARADQQQNRQRPRHITEPCLASAPDLLGPLRFTLVTMPRRSRRSPSRCATLSRARSERRTTHIDPDHPAPLPGERPPLRRPPSDQPLQDRPPPLNVSDSLDWRTYSPPAPPGRSTLRNQDRLPRSVLIAGLLACVSFSIWSSAWGTDNASPRTTATPVPTPYLSSAERPTVLIPPATHTPAPETPPPSTAPRTDRKQSKNKTRRPGEHHQSRDSAAPRQQHEAVPRMPHTTTATPPRRPRKPKPVVPEDRDSTRSAPRIAAKCDELFPPSRSGFLIRNRACHFHYG